MNLHFFFLDMEYIRVPLSLFDCIVCLEPKFSIVKTECCGGILCLQCQTTIRESDNPFCPRCREDAGILRICNDRIINNIISQAAICPRPLCENLVVDIHRHLDDCLRTTPLSQNECMFFVTNFSPEQLTALCDGNRTFLEQMQTFLAHIILDHFLFTEQYLLNN